MFRNESSRQVDHKYLKLEILARRASPARPSLHASCFWLVGDLTIQAIHHKSSPEKHLSCQLIWPFVTKILPSHTMRARRSSLSSDPTWSRTTLASLADMKWFTLRSMRFGHLDKSTKWSGSKLYAREQIEAPLKNRITIIFLSPIYHPAER